MDFRPPDSTAPGRSWSSVRSEARVPIRGGPRAAVAHVAGIRQDPDVRPRFDGGAAGR